MSQGCSSSLTLREQPEDLNDSRSTITTWRNTKPRSKENKLIKVNTMRRLYLTNKSGEGSISLPAESNEATFFQLIKPLIEGAVFKVQLQSQKFDMRKVYLSLSLTEVTIGPNDTIQTHKLLKTEIPGETQELIKQIKNGHSKQQDLEFSLVVQSTAQDKYRVKLISQDYETMK